MRATQGSSAAHAPSTPHTIDAHTVAHGSRCIRPHACNARHHCLPVSTHSLSHAMRITTHGLGHKYTKASCARKPHAHAPLTGTNGHVNTDHTRMPSHALSTAHASCVHSSCDGHGQCVRSACEMRNLYHSPMHAMHAIYSAAMRNAHGGWEQYSLLHDEHRADGQSAEGRCACENRRKIVSKAFPTREHGKHGQSNHSHCTQRAHKHGLFYILPFFAQKPLDR